MKKYFLIVTVLTVLFAYNTSRANDVSCSSDYDSAISFLNEATIGQGNKTKLLSHIKNAWRKYSSAKKNSKKNAVKDLEKALQLLNSKATKQISPQIKEDIRTHIQALIDCISDSPTVNLATLTINTFLPSDVAADGIAGPGPAGTIIYIDGTEFGVTNGNGSITLTVPARTLTVTAKLFPSNAGETSVTLAPNESRQINMILAEGKEIADDTALVIPQLQNDILDRNFTSLTLRFADQDDNTVALKTLDYVSLLDPSGGASTFITQMFVLQSDGTLLLTDISGLRNLLLARSGKILLEVHGEGVNNRIQNNVAEFFISSFKIVGSIAAPPSNPGLSKSGIFLTGTILNTNLFFNVVTDGNGNFEFPLLPTGNFEFTSETFQNNLFYYGQGTIVLNGNKSLTINMLHTDDLINGVPPFVVTPLVQAFGETPDGENKRVPSSSEREIISQGNKDGKFTLDNNAPQTNNLSVSVSVTAGTQNVPVTQTAVLNVPQGSKTVSLTYLVQTDEYPTYVLANSIYNDTWSLTVKTGGSGQAIFPLLSRQINSQLQVEPVWQSNGTTGQISKELNVESLAANSPITLVLFASAMNVGDSILPTRVQASLGVDPAVKINSITGDNSVPLNFHSIPRSGETNTFDRFLTVKITKPATATVTNLKATLMGPGELMTIVNEAPGAGNVQIIDATTIRVNVALKSTPSAVNSIPPPTHLLKYKIKVDVDVNGTQVSDEKESGERRALWRMPDGFNRYGFRDPGGDNWCSRGTYNWLLANSSLITRIDDISGEHGRNIGHQTHKHGTDIDMYHFYQFPGAVSGGDNYNKLVNDVKLAINTGSADPTVQAQALAAKQRVTQWVTATKTGLDALASSSAVTELRYALGSATTGLATGWARDLLKTGKTTVNGQLLDLGTGNWNNAKYIPVGDHNDHIHITLSRPALGEGN